jgi:GGDEF domain-containing protein/GNAT superfamily N-acetyltransferase
MTDAAQDPLFELDVPAAKPAKEATDELFEIEVPATPPPTAPPVRTVPVAQGLEAFERRRAAFVEEQKQKQEGLDLKAQWLRYRQENAALPPERQAEVFRTAAALREMGERPDLSVVEQNLDTYKKRVEAHGARWDSALKQHPALLDFLVEKPERQDLIADDMANLNGLAWALKVPYFAMRYNNEELAHQARTFEKFLTLEGGTEAPTSDPMHGAESMLGKAWAGAWNMALGPLLQYAAVGAVGAKLGAVASGPAAAAAAAATAEVGGVGGALVAAGAGAAGAGTALATLSYYQSVGPAYQRMLDQGIRPEIAAQLASAEASIMGLVDSTAMPGLLTKLGLNVTGAKKEIATGVAQALEKKGYTQALQKAAAQYGENVAHATAMMGAMGAVSATADETAALIERGETPSLADISERTSEAMMVAVRDMALLSAFAPMREARHNIGEAMRLTHDQRQLENAFRATEESKLLQRSPDEFKALLATLGQNGLKNLYSPIEAFNDYWASRRTDPREVAAELMGDDGAAYDKAMQVGGDLAIPADNYLTVLGKTEHARGLSLDLKIRENGRTPRQEQQRIERRAAELAKIHDIDVRLDEGRKLVEERLRENIERTLTGNKKIADPKAVAQKTAALNAEAFDRMARETNQHANEGTPPVTAWDVFRQRARIEFEGQKGVRAGDIAPDAFADPRSLAALEQPLRDLPEMDQLGAYYRDRNSGLLNERGAELRTPVAERPMTARFSLESKKAANDLFGHKSVDGALRIMARVLAEQQIRDGVKRGGGVEVDVRDQAHADELAAAMSKALDPSGRVKVFATAHERLGSTDETLGALGKLHYEREVAAVEAGYFAAREQFPVGYSKTPTEFNAVAEGWLRAPEGGIHADLTDAHAETFRSIGEEQTRYETFREDSGLLNEFGFHYAVEAAKEPPAYVVSADGRGIKKMNESFGRQNTNAIIRLLSDQFQRFGGGEFDMAHLHGDEYAAGANDLGRLHDFFADVRRFTDKIVVFGTNEKGSHALQEGVHFVYGVARVDKSAAEAFDRADRVELAAAKRKQGDVAEPRTDFSSREELLAEVKRLESLGFVGVDLDQLSRRAAEEARRAVGPSGGGARGGADRAASEPDAGQRSGVQRRDGAGPDGEPAARRGEEAPGDGAEPRPAAREGESAPASVPQGGGQGPGDVRLEVGAPAAESPRGRAVARRSSTALDHAWSHWDAYQHVFESIGGPDSSPSEQADGAYRRYVDGKGPRPGPFGEGKSGHFDEINIELGRAKGKGVSGALEAWNELNRHFKTGRRWERMEPVLKLMRTVPGMEKLDLPERVRTRLADRKMEQAAAEWHGIKPDPDDGELKQPPHGPDGGDDGSVGAMRDLGSDEVAAWAAEIKGRLGLRALDVHLRSDGSLKLDMIEVPAEQRQKGVGTKAMEEITALADKHGRRIVLTPDVKNDARGTTSMARLVKFYKRFGFVENKGRKRDFSVSDLMIREPQAPKSLSRRPGKSGYVLKQPGGKAGRGSISFELPRGDNKPRRYTINLDGADESTAAHETFHMLTEVLHDVAQDPSAPETLKSDYRALIEWMGHASPEERVTHTKERIALERQRSRGELSPTGDKRRIELEAKEERATAGWETYLLEGKAPSARLVSVFGRMAGWLSKVYRAGKPADQFKAAYGQDLGLTPEVRAIFDRLLASEEQLTKTREAIDNQGLPEALAEMTPEERRAYASATEQMQADARAELLRALARSAEQRAEVVDEERARIAAEVNLDLDKQPIYRVLSFLQDREIVKYDEDTGLVSRTEPPPWLIGEDGRQVRIDRKDIERLFGKDAWKTLPAGTTVSKGGIAAGELADFFGFHGAEALVRALQVAEPRKQLVDRTVQGKLEELFGPALLDSPSALYEEALAASRNDAAARRLLLEIRSLRRQLDKDIDPRIEAVSEKTRKATARRIVDETPVADLKPSYYERAAQSAARRAFDAASKGSLDKAMAERETQLLNHYLASFAREAKEQAEHVREQLEKKNRDTYRAAMGKAVREERDPTGRVIAEHRDYLAAHDSIMAALSIRQRGPADFRLDDLLARMDADVTEVVFDVGVIRGILEKPRPFDRLTPPEVAEVDAFVKNIRAASNAVLEVLVDGKRESVKGIVDRIKDDLERRPFLGTEPTSKEQVGALKRASLKVQGLDGGLIDPRAMFIMMGPEAERFFTDRYIDARTRRDELQDKVLGKLITAWEAMPKQMRERRFEIIEALDRDLPISEELNLSGPRDRQWLWMAFLNMGNRGPKSNAERLTKPFGWTEEQVEAAIAKHLTPVECDFLQEVLTLSDRELWPEIAAKEERKTGLAPEKIKASPIRLTFADGTTKTYAGGYFPARYRKNAAVGDIAERQAESAIQSFYGPNYERASTPKSHTRERAAGYSNVLDLDWSVVTNHLAQVVHDLAFDEYVRDTARVLMHPELQNTIYQRLGAERSVQPRAWLKAVANAFADSVPENMRWWQQIINPLRQRTVAAAIGASVPVMMGDLVTAPMAIAEGHVSIVNGTAATLRGMAEAPLMLIGKSEMRNRALELSPELQHRARHNERRVQDEIRAIGEKRSKAGRALDRVRVMQFAFMDATDALTSTQIWWAAFNDAESKGLPREKAVKWADDKVRAALPSRDVGEQSALLRDKRGVGSLLIFHSFFNKRYSANRLNGDAAYLAMHNESPERAALATAAAVGRILAAAAMYGAASEFLSGRGQSEDESTGEWFVRKMLGSLAATIPFGGFAQPLIDFAVTGSYKPASVRAAPGLSLLDQAVGNIGKLATGKRTDAQRVWDAIELALIGLGGPARQMRNTGEYVTNLIMGNARSSSVPGIVSGVGYGERQRQPANPANVFDRPK